MNARRAHSKSRNGCVACKTRKVKVFGGSSAQALPYLSRRLPLLTGLPVRRGYALHEVREARRQV